MKIVNRIMKSGILCVVLVLSIIVSISFGWYTHTSMIGKIDAETQDVSFSYKLNEGKTNVIKYEVKNLAFFDVDDPKELKYFISMHTVIKIDLENYSSGEVNYYVEFNSEKNIVTVDEKVVSISYVVGILSADKELSITDDGTNSISSYMNENYLTETGYSVKYESSKSLAVSDGSNSEAKAVLYLHLFGVQEIDNAINEFLIDKNGNLVNYEFTLTIHSDPVNSEPNVN